MWFLTADNDKRIIYLLPGKDIVIGRSLDAQNCNFAIPEDQSISRKHATILIFEDNLYLKDLGSKYGTYVNDSEKVEHNVMIKLNINDIVKFGKIGCTWTVQKINFITCTSTLKGENLQNLKNLLTKLGGTFMSEWDDTCQYLTMPAITLTIKVVLALVQNSNIVTLNYWSKCVEAITNNIPLPNPGDFIPQILESSLNKENVSFLPLKERSSIFAGKKIIFFSRRQMEMYKIVLMKSSASALLLSDSKLTKSALCEENVIVVQYNLSSTVQETQTQKDQIIDIINYLKTKGKRIVADAEIGLAILYCSTEKYCNPNFNFTSEVIKQVPIQNIPHNILVQESEEVSQVSKKENVLIDESLSPRHNLSNSNNDISIVASKRKLSEDDNSKMCSVNKKFAVDSLNKNNNSSKRSGEHLHNLEINPSKKMALESKDGDDIFNFVNSTVENNTNESNQNKKLDLSKPLKRKHSTEMDEDDLFNFVDNKKLIVGKDNILSHTKLETFDEDNSIVVKKTSKTVIEDTVDISALRGSKLDDLMKINSNIPCHRNIKKEDISELDSKFSGIDIGSTIVIVKTLIVKREPLQIQSSLSELKNFKKFKKVWPLKMQVTMIPKPSINIPETDIKLPDENIVN